MNLHPYENKLLDMDIIQELKDLWQRLHHEYDVFGHTMQVVKYLKKMTDDKDIITAGYLHDIGKKPTAEKIYKDSKTFCKDKEKPYHTFFEHEKVGKDMILRMEDDFFIKNGLKKQKIAHIVGYHFIPMSYIKKMRQAKNLSEYVNLFEEMDETLSQLNGGVNKGDVLNLFLADKLGQGENVPDIQEIFLIHNCLSGIEHKYLILEKLYNNTIS